MNTADDLLRRALEALESLRLTDLMLLGFDEVRDDIRAYLDAPKDEPVAWGVFEDDQIHDVMFSEEYAVEQAGFKGDHAVVKPLYLHPPTKTAPKKPMTEKEFWNAYRQVTSQTLYGIFRDGVRFAERHHGITDE